MCVRNSPCSCAYHMQVMRFPSSTLMIVISGPPDLSWTISPGWNVIRGLRNQGRRALSPISGSRPLHDGRHRRQDRIDVSAGAQPEDRTAVIQQVELDIAPAPDQLLLALGLDPRRREVSSHQLRIDGEECTPDILRERESRVPVRLEIVIKDAAHAAHLVPMLEKEILVAPRLELVVGRDRW